MARFRKKPVVIEAVLWNGTQFTELPLWLLQALGTGTILYIEGTPELLIKTLEEGLQGHGRHVASPGDWIIRGIKGELYPCKPDVFDATYEAMNGEPPNAS